MMYSYKFIQIMSNFLDRMSIVNKVTGLLTIADVRTYFFEV
jgi:hypothetical protein